MDSIFNKYNFNVLTRDEAESIKGNINISYKKLSCGYELYLKNLINSNWKMYADVIRNNFGPPCYTICSRDKTIDIWVITSKKFHEAFYIEYWRNASPPYMYIYTNKDNAITNSFIRWLSLK